ncbi:MAG TPA: dephospho-CoA kinase [Clostridiales bacterium]|nr:dephospho-CoA kinase [Clostridiales bacterium]
METTRGRRVFIVGLTGGIASGKTTVADMLRESGAMVLDADQAARELTESMLPDLVREFGDGIQAADGTLDRSRLADLIFRDATARCRLNAITHPPTFRRLRRELEHLERDGAWAVVLVVPLLVEAGMTALVDRVWVVACSPESQLARIARRDGLSPEQAALRLAAQAPLADKLRAAHAVIDNDGALADTCRQVRGLWSALGRERPRGLALARWTQLVDHEVGGWMNEERG